MTDLPEPPVPADCDLQDFPYMPLQIGRLLDSTFSAKATDAEFRAGMVLWCKAWHQVPAGSLPNDERVLAHLAGFGRDLKAWAKVREMALHGFYPAADGRLYHPVVAEQASESWVKKCAWAKNRQKEREKKSKQRKKDGTDGGNGGDGPGSDAGRPPVCPPGQQGDIPGLKGKGRDKNSSDDKSSGAETPDPVKALFDFGIAVFTASGRSEREARTLLGKLRRDSDDPKLMSLLVAARNQSAVEPFEYIQGALRRDKRRQEGFGGVIPLGVGG
jgi:hypothetical protein